MKATGSITAILRSLVALTVGTTFMVMAPPPAVRATETLEWRAEITEGATVTGLVLASIESTNTSYVKQWCVYLDGKPLTGRSYEENFPATHTLPPASTYSSGSAARSAGDQSSPGCWTVDLALRRNGLSIYLDTTVWTDGPHAIKFEATTGNGAIETKTVNVRSKNTLPTVTWDSASQIAIADTIRLTAKVTPQTHFVTEVCLKYDDTLIPKSDKSTFMIDPPQWNERSDTELTLGSDGAGCFSFDQFRKGGGRRGIPVPTIFTIDLRTTTWKTVPKTLTLTIKDAVNRVASTSLEFSQTAKTPKLSFTDTPNFIIRETGTLQQSLEASNASVAKVCAYLNDQAHAALEVNGCVEGAAAATFVSDSAFSIDTSSLANGSYTVKVTVFDRWGRSQSSSLTFNVDNKQPQLNITQPTGGQAISRWIDALIVTSIPSEMKTTTLSRLCVTTDQAVDCNTHSIPISSNLSSQTSTYAINTACLQNGSHQLNAHLQDSRQQLVQKSVTFDVRNKKPVITRASMTLNKPTWRQERTSGTLRFNGTGGCTYKVEIRTPNGNRIYATSGDFTDDTPGGANIAVRGLPASTRLTATITSKNTLGTAQRTIAFTTPAIPAPPPPPPSSGGGSSGGGSGGGSVPIVIGWNLARVPSFFTKLEHPSCPTLFGILWQSNWVVVAQNGYTVYACKFD